MTERRQSDSVAVTPLLVINFDGVLHSGSGLGYPRFILAKALEIAQDRVSVQVVISSPNGHPNSPAYGHLKLPHLS
jgi:hypothetical protein